MVIMSQKLFTDRACASMRLRHLCILPVTGGTEAVKGNQKT